MRPTVLLVDDDDVDVMAVRRAFREAGIDTALEVARNGCEALDALRGANGRARIPHPRVVLLDLAMPRMGGFGFLEELRRDPELRSTVVFVLTTSEDKDDVARAYTFNVAGYVVKTPSGDGLADLVRVLHRYWQVVAFP